MARILIAEDHPQILDNMKTKLKKQGHTVITATNPTEAFAAFEASQEQHLLFDIVITDWQMPRKDDGLTVMQYLNARRYTGHVIVHSGNDEDPRFQMMKEAFERFASLQWVVKGNDLLTALPTI